MVLYEMEEHTFTELDSQVDWKVVSHMVADYGFFPPGAKRPKCVDELEPPASGFYLGVAAGLVAAVVGMVALGAKGKIA